MYTGTTATIPRAKVSNAEVAELIGLDKTHVSRIRSNQRVPSMRLMPVIEEKFGFKVADQVAAANAKSYGARLETVLVEIYGGE